jgi:hypothetical protein
MRASRRAGPSFDPNADSANEQSPKTVVEDSTSRSPLG